MAVNLSGVAGLIDKVERSHDVAITSVIITGELDKKVTVTLLETNIAEEEGRNHRMWVYAGTGDEWEVILSEFDAGDIPETTISKTDFTFSVVHRTDDRPNSLEHALEQADTGGMVGNVTDVFTVSVDDEDVPDTLRELGNDGEFFDVDLRP